MFVTIEAIESPVDTVTTLAKRIINRAPPKPAFPTTHPRRKYIIAPRIVNIVGVKTPSNVPKRLLELNSAHLIGNIKTATNL